MVQPEGFVSQTGMQLCKNIFFLNFPTYVLIKYYQAIKKGIHMLVLILLYLFR